jgi:hypothetical protein
LIVSKGSGQISQASFLFAGYQVSIAATTNTPGGNVPGSGVIALQTANTITVTGSPAAANPLVVDLVSTGFFPNASVGSTIHVNNSISTTELDGGSASAVSFINGSQATAAATVTGPTFAASAGTSSNPDVTLSAIPFSVDSQLTLVNLPEDGTANITWTTTTTAPALSIASPTINTTQQPAIATVGSPIADQAAVAGGNNPTGTVTFNLYNNPNGTGTPLFTDTEMLFGGTATSKGYTTTATGTDYWVATYNGDSNNASVTSGTSLEPVTVSPATPAITTCQQPAIATVGTSINDKAFVTGGFNPTGTVTFNLYNNANGTGTALFTDTEMLFGGTATSKGYATTATGTDYWVAAYNGDSNNAPVISGTALEPVVIVPITPLGANATATMGYWHNKNGQALINGFNGGPTSTQLGNWLASNFSNLFGGFAGQTNAQVAADFLTAFGNVGGVQGNTYAQTFAVALAVYATDPTLGGGSASIGQGFTVKPGGTGSDTFNVGSNGAAFGVANNTSLTVLQVLQILNLNYSPVTDLFYLGSSTLTGDANNVSNGINQKGDI